MNVCELTPQHQVGTLLSFAAQSCDTIAASIKETLLHSQESFEGIHAVEPLNYMPITEIDINGERKSLLRPILFGVAREGEVYIVENQALNIVASGETVAEAIADAKDTIVNDFGFYSTTPESGLVGLGVKLKKVYASLF